jgi:aryl-alcohol dehydrogenase-like predicted oxidoreductase
MEWRPLGTSGTFVTALGLGGVTLGRELTERESRSVLDAYVAGGGNLVDTADLYADGRSEEFIGRWLDARRPRLVIATKVGMRGRSLANGTYPASRRHIRQSVESSLRRLRCDWIDLYQLHRWDPLTPLEETLSTLADLVASGHVRYVGVSNYMAWQVEQCLQIADMHRFDRLVSIQSRYSLLVRDVERDIEPLCADARLALLAWSPLAGGVLTGKYGSGGRLPAGSRGASAHGRSVRERLTERNGRIVQAVREVAREVGMTPTQVALNWLMHRPVTAAALVSVTSTGQLAENLSALGWRLDAASLARLDTASRPEAASPDGDSPGSGSG